MVKIISAVEKLSKWSGKVLSFAILIMVGAVCFEVVARYVFNNPTEWAHELTTMLYGSYCLLVGAYTHLNKEHVRMDAIYQRFSRRTQATVDFFTGLLAVGFLGTYLVIACQFALRSWAVREFSGWSPWEPPLYPFKMVIALAVLLLLLQQIAWLIRNFAVMLNKKGFLTEPSKEQEAKGIIS